MKGKVMFRDKKETQRWLEALEIAKVVFWHEGYHTQYLEELEDFVRRKRMYTPKIKAEHIPKLYKLSQKRKVPMTRLVNKIISEYLAKEANASAVCDNKNHGGTNQHAKKTLSVVSVFLHWASLAVNIVFFPFVRLIIPDITFKFLI